MMTNQAKQIKTQKKTQQIYHKNKERPQKRYAIKLSIE